MGALNEPYIMAAAMYNSDNKGQISIRICICLNVDKSIRLNFSVQL